MVDHSDLRPGDDRDVDGADGFPTPGGVERRVWRNLFAVIALSVILAVLFADLKFVLGTLLGGGLAVFNYRWLNASLRGIIAESEGGTPPGTAMKFVTRWLVIALVGYGAYSTGYFDPIAIVTGLLTPAGAVLIEAVYVTYRSLTGGVGDGE